MSSFKDQLVQMLEGPDLLHTVKLFRIFTRLSNKFERIQSLVFWKSAFHPGNKFLMTNVNIPFRNIHFQITWR